MVLLLAILLTMGYRVAPTGGTVMNSSSDSVTGVK